jgi:hypothetical protein
MALPGGAPRLACGTAWLEVRSGLGLQAGNNKTLMPWPRYKGLCRPFLLSFPRRRESIWPAKINMDSCFRGNDKGGILFFLGKRFHNFTELLQLPLIHGADRFRTLATRVSTL